MQRRYDIKAKVRYHNTALDIEVKEGGKSTITFDSTFEYDVYLLLKEKFKDYNIQIECHPYFMCSGIRWKVDFRLVAYDTKSQYLLSRLLQICSNSDKQAPTAFLYIECKGAMNKRFTATIDKIHDLSPKSLNSLILVGLESTAYTKELVNEQKVYIKPVISLYAFRKWLKSS